MVADSSIEKFMQEMDAVLRREFIVLSRRLNGHGRPTTNQLTACVMASAAEIQATSPYFIPDQRFDEVLDPFRKTPFYGESVRPMYNEVVAVSESHKDGEGNA